MSRKTPGNPLRILGKAQSLGWRTHLAFAVPAFLAAIFFDLSRVTGGTLSWLGLATLGYAVTVLAIYGLSKLLGKSRWAEPKPVLSTVILLIAGFARGATIYLVGIALNIISADDWLFRLMGGPIYVFSTYLLLNWLVDEFVEYSREFNRLQSEKSRLAKASTEFEEQIASLQELQRASIRELLSPAIWELQKMLESAKSQSDLRSAIFELRSINERLVRPLSRALTADALSDDALGAANAIGPGGGYRLPRRIRYSGVIGVQFFLISSAAISLSALVTLFGMVSGPLILLIATIVSWAFLKLFDNYFTKELPTQLGVLVSMLLGVVIGVTIATITSLTGLSSFMPFFLQSVLFYALAVPMAFVLGVFRAQREVTLTDLNATLEQLKLVNSRLRQRVWLSRKSLAMELHGSIQGALQSVAMRLSNLRRPSAKDIAKAVEDINLALARLETEDHLAGKSIETLLDELQQLWEGALDLRFTLEKSAIRQLTHDSAASRCVLEVAREAITNAVKHGDAKRVSLNLDASNQMINLVVENDGKPFRESSRGKGQELYQSVSHRYWFEKVKNKTRLVVQIPLSPAGASQPLV